MGPLVVASVYIEQAGTLGSIPVKDSKKMSDRSIRQWVPRLMELLPYSVVKILPGRYNELYREMRNLNIMLGWAHARALQNLLQKGLAPRVVIIDRFGPEIRLLRYLPDQEVKEKIHFFTQGEADTAVACASLIARYTFIQEMEKLSDLAGFPLPYGAGAEADQAARRIRNTIGEDALPKFAKMNFKNISRL